jgi:hypothetical protein
VQRLLPLLIVAGTGIASAQDLPPSQASQPSRVKETLPASPSPFTKGETLNFLIKYGFIQAGTASLQVSEVVDRTGRTNWRLLALAQSTGFFDSVYQVRNSVESLWDPREHYSHHYSEDRLEGRHTTQNTITFDLNAKVARYQNGKVYPIPSGVQDALSAFYFTRYQALPIGGSFSFDYHASKVTQKLEVKVLGRETVTTPAGTFSCVMIEPLLRAGGIFRNKGRLVIWVTDDARRIPVLMKSKVMIGSISVVLQEIKS